MSTARLLVQVDDVRTISDRRPKRLSAALHASSSRSQNGRKMVEVKSTDGALNT